MHERIVYCSACGIWCIRISFAFPAPPSSVPIPNELQVVSQFVQQQIQDPTQSRLSCHTVLPEQHARCSMIVPDPNGQAA